MQRMFSLLILLAFGLIVGCASQENVQALRAEITAMERQLAQRDKGTADQFNALDQRLANLEQSQAEARRDLAQSIAASEALHLETRRLQGNVQETQHRMQRHATPSGEMRDLLATKIAELDTRLKALESGSSAAVQPHSPAPPPAPPPQTAKPAPPMQSPPPPRDASAERAYDRALQEYQRGNYEVAIVLFKQFLRQHPKASQAPQAQYWIGESLYAQRQYEAAIVAFDEVIQKYPRDTHVPTALLKQGYAFAELKDIRNARFFLQQVIKRYPQRSEAQQAEEKLKQLEQRQG